MLFLNKFKENNVVTLPLQKPCKKNALVITVPAFFIYCLNRKFWVGIFIVGFIGYGLDKESN